MIAGHMRPACRLLETPDLRDAFLHDFDEDFEKYAVYFGFAYPLALVSADFFSWGGGAKTFNLPKKDQKY